MASLHLTTARSIRALHPGQSLDLTVHGVEFRVRCGTSAGSGRRRLTLYRRNDPSGWDHILGEYYTNSGCARRITGGSR